MIDELVMNAVMHERAYQEDKWPGHNHNLIEWITILEDILLKAKHNLVIHPTDDPACHELRQLAATAIAAMEQLGIFHERTIAQFTGQFKCDMAHRIKLVSGSEHGLTLQIIGPCGNIPDGIVYRNLDGDPVLYQRNAADGNSVLYHCSHVINLENK